MHFLFKALLPSLLPTLRRAVLTNLKITVKAEMKQQSSNTGEYLFGTSIDLILVPEQKRTSGSPFCFHVCQ